MERLRPLFPYLKPCRRSFVAGVLCTIAMAVIGLLRPLVIGDAIDRMREDISRETLLVYGGVILGITLVQGFFRFGQRLILVAMSRRIEFDLRNDFFAHLETLEAAAYQRFTTGDLMARATNDLGAVRMLCGPAIMYSTNTLFTATGALILMFGVHPKLSVVALLTLPMVAVITRIFGQRIHVLFGRVQESFSKVTTQVQENLSGARVVRAYAREQSEQRRFAEYNEEYVGHNRRLILWQAAFMPLVQAFVGMGFALVLWYGGRLMVQGEITVGEFVTFHLFFVEMVWPMIAIGWVINIYQRGTASLARLQEVLDTPPGIRDEEPLERPERIHGAVRFQGLTFAYGDGPPVLTDLDIDGMALVGK